MFLFVIRVYGRKTYLTAANASGKAVGEALSAAGLEGVPFTYHGGRTFTV